jgi:hypothetical protein
MSVEFAVITRDPNAGVHGTVRQYVTGQRSDETKHRALRTAENYAKQGVETVVARVVARVQPSARVVDYETGVIG